RPGGLAGLLARAGRARMDARAGPPVAPHDRDRGAWRRGRHRRRDRRGPGRTRFDLPLRRHRRRRSRRRSGTGTPEPGGMQPRELLRAVRRIVGAVELAGMDIVEVSPPYDWAESTAMIANRAAME